MGHRAPPGEVSSPVQEELVDNILKKKSQPSQPPTEIEQTWNTASNNLFFPRGAGEGPPRGHCA